MPFNRPSLQTLIDRVAADIESRLAGASARLRRSVLAVLGRAMAGVAHGLHGHLDWLAKQLLVSTCGEAFLYVHAAVWKVPRKQATQAAGSVDFTGTTGTVIPAGTELQRVDGEEYTTDAEATLVAGAATVTVTAVTAGLDGNAAAATTLNLVNPIAGLNGEGSVDGDGLTGGADIEGVQPWRARIVARIQAPPHGGRKEDYEGWALEVAEVTRVWVEPLWAGDGTVGVYFVCDDLDPIIPIAAKVTEVQDYLDPLRPVTADVTAIAPTGVALDLTLHVAPDTAAVRATVEAEIEDLLRREAEPAGTILLSHINEAISLAAGETDHELTAPIADVNHAAGELAVPGVITWT
jgi:uncharacterized phage protein gp47/JayE